MYYDPNKKYESQSYDVLPAGHYLVDVVKTEVGTNNNGNPFIQVKLRVLNGRFKKWFVSNRYVLTEKSQNVVFEAIQAMGVNQGFDTANGEEVHNALIGKIFWIDTVVEEGKNGKSFPAIKFRSIKKPTNAEMDDGLMAQEELGLPDEDMRKPQDAPSDDGYVPPSDDDCIPF